MAKRTKVVSKKQSEKAIFVVDAVESPKNVEKEAPKKTRSRSRSASIAEEPPSNVPDGFDRFVLDTSNEISAFLNEANIGLSPDTEKRSLMNEAVSFDYYRVRFLT